MIKIVGLGPGGEQDLTLKSIDIMKNANNLYLRTYKHPNVDYLRSIGIKFETFDSFYDTSMEFDEVYERIAREVVNMDEVVYAVPGHPLVAEKSVQLILEYAGEKGTEVEIVPAISFVDAMIGAVKADPVEGLKIIDGLQLDRQKPDTKVGNVITQVYSRLIASDIKIRLMDVYDDEQEVYMIRAAGVPGLEKIERMPLYNIDRVDWVDYLTSIYVPPVINNKKYDFSDLLEIMEVLRGDDGCPWDREQTHESLREYLIEEAYEVVDAIEGNDMDALSEELGDVLLQVVFHSQIGKEFGEFDIRDVVHGIANKLVNRHSHIFAEDKCSNPKEVEQNWDRIKKEEKNIKSHTEALKLVPRVLPALIRSYKVQEKAAKVGFDWDRVEDAVLKVEEELRELLEVYKGVEVGKITEELGDLFFAVVNVSRFLDINPEFALTKTVEKFITRFEYIEKTAASKGKTLEEMTLEEMDELWNCAKSE